MKSASLTLVFSVVFAVMFVGTLLMPGAVAMIEAFSVDFDPKTVDLSHPDLFPGTVIVTIRFKAAHGEDQLVVDINTSTVLLEGSVSAIPGSNSTKDKPPEYSCEFNGPAVRNVMWMIIYHDGLPPNPQGNYVVHMTITGNLYDGTPFTGEGHIQVKPAKGEHSPPPPTG